MAFRLLRRPVRVAVPRYSIHGTLAKAAREAGPLAGRQAQAPVGLKQPRDFQLRLY